VHGVIKTIQHYFRKCLTLTQNKVEVKAIKLVARLPLSPCQPHRHNKDSHCLCASHTDIILLYDGLGCSPSSQRTSGRVRSCFTSLVFIKDNLLEHSSLSTFNPWRLWTCNLINFNTFPNFSVLCGKQSMPSEIPGCCLHFHSFTMLLQLRTLEVPFWLCLFLRVTRCVEGHLLWERWSQLFFTKTSLFSF
jgi:hypothetical protein